MKCILCEVDTKLTREHILPRSLIEKFNDLENTDDNNVLRSINHNGIVEFSNVERAKALKPIKNICGVCNSDRSTLCDNEFSNFIWSLFLWGKTNGIRCQQTYPKALKYWSFLTFPVVCEFKDGFH